MTHHHGSLYQDWQRSEAGITALAQELAQEQVTHVDLAEYQPGTSHYEMLMAQLDLATRFQQPDTFTVNL